jgi:hypothetical protein
VACIACSLIASVAEAQVQDLGHRIPAGVGLDAGTPPDPGLYVGDRVVWLAANELRDRNGALVPVKDLDLDVYANMIGVAGTKRLGGLYVSAAFAIPLIKVALSSDEPAASVDRLDLGDAFVQPLGLGTRFHHLDVVGSYSFYAPTGQGARSGVGRPQWSHQLSAGGTVFLRRPARLAVVHARKLRPQREEARDRHHAR